MKNLQKTDKKEFLKILHSSLLFAEILFKMFLTL